METNLSGDLAILSALLAKPLVFLGPPVIDRKIGNAAKASCVYHITIEADVTIEARDGVAAQAGCVQDREDGGLAEDMVEKVRGVRRVKLTVSL